MPAPTYEYITYLQSSADRVWHALTDAKESALFWGHSNRSDWREGSRWSHVRTDGSEVVDVEGTVLESQRPTKLTITFDQPEGQPSIVTFEITEYHEIVRVRVIHDQVPSADDRAELAHGWPAVAANLKTYLETGKPLSTPPWDMARKG